MKTEEAIKAVGRMQDYIMENLNSRMTLSDLAKAAGYSQIHSARIFTELTGKRPFEYLRAYRLTEAAKILRNNDIKIIDVAFDFVFDTHEGFSRAFTKEFGISPYRYKKNPIPMRYFVPYKVTDRYPSKNKEKLEMKKKEFIFTQVVTRPKRKAIIKRGVNASDYYEYCEEAGCDVWGVLESVKEAMYEPAGFWLPKKLIKKGTSKYVQGVEVPDNYPGVVPDGFELIELEPCQVMVFQGEPYDDEDFENAISGVWEAINKFDPKLYGFQWADADAPNFQLMPQGYRGYIEARAVKKIDI